MKMKMIPAILILMFIMISCGKDKFTTEPQVKVTSISPDQVFQGNLVRLRGSFTDQEGDVDSVFVVYKWYNGAVVSRLFDTLKIGTDNLKLPKNTKQGDIFLEYAYGRQIDGYVTLGGTPVVRDTTVTLGLVLKDKKGNRSGYAESDKIRFKRP